MVTVRRARLTPAKAGRAVLAMITGLVAAAVVILAVFLVLVASVMPAALLGWGAAQFVPPWGAAAVALCAMAAVWRLLAVNVERFGRRLREAVDGIVKGVEK